MNYAKLMHQYAIAMYGLDQTHEADVLLLIAFQIYDALGMCNTLQYAQALVTRGKRQYVQELYAKSIDTFNSAKKIVDEGKNNYVHFNVMIRVELSISYQKTGQFYFAENMLLEARLISKAHYTRGKTLLDLAKLYMNINKYNLALPCLYEAKRNKQNVDALIALAKKMIHYEEVKRLVDNSWVKHRRDMLECDCCRKRFAILNVSQDGIKYCDGEECVKNTK
jgi:tetratricopeptide (TPR) repeat protein